MEQIKVRGGTNCNISFFMYFFQFIICIATTGSKLKRFLAKSAVVIEKYDIPFISFLNIISIRELRLT